MTVKTYKSGELSTGVFFLLVSLVFLIGSLLIDTSGQPVWSSSMIVPLLLSMVMFFTSAVNVFKVAKNKKESEKTVSVYKKDALIYMFVVFAYISALFVIPFWLASVVFVFFSYIYWKSLPLIKAAVASASIVAITMGIFAKVFYIVF